MFDDIEQSIGRHNAIKLVRGIPKRGKRSWRRFLYVPKRMKSSHMLVDILGESTARKLSKDLGGLSIQPSNGNSIYRRFRNREVRRMGRSGMSVGCIAESVGLSSRMIRKILGPSERGVVCG